MKIIRLLFYILLVSSITILLWGMGTKHSIVPNVDKVYEEYFSEYRFNDSVKEEILTELKLLINYFTYEKAQGKDVYRLMTEAENLAVEQLSLSAIQIEFRKIKSFVESSESIPFKGSNSATGHCKDFSEFLQYQKNLTEEYNLPYYIENSALQVLNINGALASKEGIEIEEVDLVEDSLLSTDNKNMKQLKRFPWHSADIIVGHRKNAKKTNAIQGFYNHMGIYNKQCKCIIDAVPPSLHGKGGVRQSSWEYWADNFTQIAILRIKGLSLEQREKIATYAFEKLNEPYNISTYKKNEEGGWYCSKLIYASYRNAGIDLDRKHGVTLFPDDIAMHPGLETLTCLPMEK